MKYKLNWIDFPGFLVGLFLTIFFLLYLGRFGFTDMIIKEYNNWHQLFNISAWSILALSSIKLLYEDLGKFIYCTKRRRKCWVR